MTKNDVEQQVREFYDSEGWLTNDSGVTGEDVYFRNIKVRWSHFVGQVGGQVKVYSDA